MGEWLLYKDEQMYGPFSYEQLFELRDRREIDLDDYVWTEGMAEWQPVYRVLQRAGAAAGPAGLGGWLLPVAAILMFNGASALVGTVGILVSRENAAVLAAGGQPFWLVLLLNGCYVLLSAWLLQLFFQRKRLFPSVFVAFVGAWLLLVPLSVVSAAPERSLAELAPKLAPAAATAVVVGGLLIGYVLRARRVRNTFVA